MRLNKYLREYEKACIDGKTRSQLIKEANDVIKMLQLILEHLGTKKRAVKR
jgi:heme oxygenase